MHFLLACLLLGASLIHGAHARPSSQEPEKLRSNYQERLSRLSIGRQRCLELKKEFEGFDRFTGYGSRVLGLDVWGRVWFLKNTGRGSCELKSSFRLEKPDYELNEYGEYIWNVYHYEGIQLCLYSRLARESVVKRICYDPVGIVSKYAPYMTH